MLKSFLLVMLALMTACGGTPEPQPSSPAATPATTAAVPASGPQLVTGLGEHHHPMTTSNAEAQKFFDQGFAWVYAFNHEEASVPSSARRARSEGAMPQWGIAWALGPNYNLDIDDPRAKQAFRQYRQRPRPLRQRFPTPEREYVAAMAVRYSPDPKADRAALARRYSQAMGDVMRRYPDDLDAATLTPRAS